MIFILLLLKAESSWFSGFIVFPKKQFWQILDFWAKLKLIVIDIVSASFKNSFVIRAIKEENIIL